MSEAMRQPETPDNPPASPQEKRPSRSKGRILGITLIIVSFLIGWFLLIGFLGWQRGERLRVENEQSALNDQLARQKELAQINISEEDYTLALSRLDWVLEQRPDDVEAISLKADAENGITALFTPTPTPRFTPTPVPTPLPTPTAGPISSPEDELQRIRRMVATKDWETAVSALINFQFEYPNYERQETDKFLYDAYIELALDNLNGEMVELGMFYLSQAAQLGELSQAMLDYETWAELYLQGIAFYGANWDASAYYFRDLCLAAPFYQDSCSELQDVLILYGEQKAGEQDWCPAAELYLEASAYDFVPNLNEKLEQANEMCALATPTPEVVDPEEDIEGTPESDETVDTLSFQTATPSPQPTTGP